MEVEMFSHFPDLQGTLISKPPCLLAESSCQLFSSQAMERPGCQESHGRDSKQEGTRQQPGTQEQCWVLPWLSPGFHPVMLDYKSRETPACCSHNSNGEMTAPPWWYQKKSWLIWKLRQGVGACLPTRGLLQDRYPQPCQLQQQLQQRAWARFRLNLRGFTCQRPWLLKRSSFDKLDQCLIFVNQSVSVFIFIHAILQCSGS